MVDALAKLGFSFWQVVVLIVALVFKSELRKLISRLSQVKAGNTELAFSDEQSQDIEDLKHIKDKLEDQSQTKESIKNILEEKISERALDAILNIKIHTLFLWKEISNKAGSYSWIKADLLEKTVYRVERDLHLLKRAGYIDYEVNAGYMDIVAGERVYVVTIKKMTEEFVELVNKAKNIRVESPIKEISIDANKQRG